MRISKKCDYAIRALMEVSVNHYEEYSLRVEEITTRQAIPYKFLKTIFGELRRAGLISSRKGPGGGYYLAKEPADIFLIGVIEVMDGPLNSYEVVGSERENIEAFHSTKVISELFESIFIGTREDIAKITFKDLSERYLKRLRAERSDSRYSI